MLIPSIRSITIETGSQIGDVFLEIITYYQIKLFPEEQKPMKITLCLCGVFFNKKQNKKKPHQRTTEKRLSF